MKPKHCEKIAAFGDNAIACVTALVVATRDVRADIMDVDQMSEPLHFFKRYKFYFLRHKQNAITTDCKIVFSAKNKLPKNMILGKNCGTKDWKTSFALNLAMI